MDQAIRVERKTLKRDEKDSGSKRDITYEYAIEVKNFKRKSISMEIYDRVPTSRQGDIEVKLLDTKPEPTEREDGGILMWRLNLSPGAENKIQLSYRVRFPKDRRVMGLP